MQALRPNDPVSRPVILDPEEQLPVAVGDVVGFKYEVEAILGVGSMAVVAAATDTGHVRRVALKVMRTPRMTPENVERFVAEADAAINLKSAHVARVLDVGKLSACGTPYMVTELLAGSDLATKLEREGAIPPALAIDYILQACDALMEAHRLGIIHRDLKPDNLFLVNRDGTPLVKLLDLGISKTTTPADSSPTTIEWPRAVARDGRSSAYMSPEQIRSATVDARADVWALGAILFELVTGHCPFAGMDVPDAFLNVLEKPTPSLETYLPSAPPGLGAVIQRCLEKDPKKRYTTVGAFAAALADLAEPKPSSSTPPLSDRSIDPSIDSRVMESPSRSGMHSSPTPRTKAETFMLPRRRPWRLRLALAVALIAIAGLSAEVVIYRNDLTVVQAASATTASALSVPPSASAIASAVAVSVPPSASAIASAPPQADEPPVAAAAPAETGTRVDEVDATGWLGQSPKTSTTETQGPKGKPRGVRPRRKRPKEPAEPKPTADVASPSPPAPVETAAPPAKKRERTEW